MELITVQEMDDLPDDPAVAFVQLERICRTRLNESLSDDDRYNNNDTVRLEYMTVVAAAAAAYGIANFGNADELTTDDFRPMYQRAIAVATRLAIDAKQARAVESVALPLAAKERLKKHLEDLRKALNASELSERKRQILGGRLDEFEKELGKEKSNTTRILASVALVAAAMNQFTGVGTGVEDFIIKLPETVNAVNVLLGKEKLKELEAAPAPLPLPPGIAPKALPAPSNDFDDDVPF